MIRYDKWHILPGDPEGAAALEEAGIPALAALVLSARGYDTPEEAWEFLRKDTGLLHDPFLLRDMDRATVRLTEALKRGERICVYGDYDVDGITATCLLTSFLTQRGADVLPYIPNRLTEGYSLNDAAVRSLARQGVKLIVTVDCGITNVEEMALAAALGVDVVVTDHHECKERLPDAVAVVGPTGRTAPIRTILWPGSGWR
ncbi:MAG: DHH family phosphoesterase [Clostridiales bacterium]|nr:DHH family phosphoesterase [Clostridiales bacterium]